MCRSSSSSVNINRDFNFFCSAFDECSQMKMCDFNSIEWSNQFKHLNVITNANKAVNIDVLICKTQTNRKTIAANYRIVTNKDHEYIDLFTLIFFTNFKSKNVYLSADFNMDYLIRCLETSPLYYNKFINAIDKCNFII